MKKKIVIVSAVIVGLFLIIISVYLFIKSKNTVDFDYTIDVTIDEKRPKVEALTSPFLYSVDGFEELLVIMSESELEGIMSSLKAMFTDYFPAVMKLNMDRDSYYSQYFMEIKATTGLTSSEEFSGLYNKIMRLPDYKKCHLQFNKGTLEQMDDAYAFDMTALFHDTTEIVFNIQIDRRSMDLVIE